MVRKASSGVESAHEAWAEGMENYQPARPLGNRHDAESISKQSGRPVEEFLSDEEKEARVVEQEGEVVDPDKNSANSNGASEESKKAD